MKAITLVLLISLFFSACSEKKPCIPKKIYIKSKVPRLKVLYEVKPYEIKDFRILDNSYYVVNKEQLHLASKASKKRISNIRFYEKQNMRFNKEFSDVQTK